MGNFTKSMYSGIRGNARRFRLTALLKYTSYEIRMRTVNELGESPYSPVVPLRTQEYGECCVLQYGGKVKFRKT